MERWLIRFANGQTLQANSLMQFTNLLNRVEQGGLEVKFERRSTRPYSTYHYYTAVDPLHEKVVNAFLNHTPLEAGSYRVEVMGEKVSLLRGDKQVAFDDGYSYQVDDSPICDAILSHPRFASSEAIALLSRSV